MQVPISWLNNFCNSNLGVDDLAERLAMTGTEVERVVRHGAPSNAGFVVGKVLTREKHLDADKLSVCTVDVGADSPSTIVCGAPNVDAEQTVAVALPGAVMPDGTKLKKAKLRGVESNGMILAEDELSIGGDHDGIMQLELEPGFSAEEYKPGTPLSEVLSTGEDVLELEITPNRPDCLGVHGVAREVHAITGQPLEPLPDGPEIGGDETFDISVEDHDLCPRFTARVFRNVKVGPSPLWLKSRLSAAGQRPINNVVDITNYVMLLTGQPMHAFDIDKIRGQKLVVRSAANGEKVTTLDGVERAVDDQTVLVCDDEGPSAIAGIMGGAVSEVSEETTSVLLEVATWNGPNIHRTSQLLGLRSEASGRFEKGLPPQLPPVAQEVASALLVELTGATLASETIDVAGALEKPQPITLHAARVSGLLGTAIPIARCAEILERLEFEVTIDGEQLAATPPHFRAADVTREADLIEEVARIEGVDSFPATLPAAADALGRLSASQRMRRALEDLLTANGYHEAITWSFTGETLLDRLMPDDGVAMPTLKIANPLSEEHSLMRPLVLPGLLEVAQHNFARGAEHVRLFENGAVYGGTPQAPVERTILAILLCGSASPTGWRGEDEPGDFYALKGVIEALAKLAGVTIDFAPLDAERRPFLIPGRSAELSIAGEPLGYLGELHPTVAKRFDLVGGTATELDIEVIVQHLQAASPFEPFSSFPPAREDIAIVVKSEIPAATVLDAVRNSAGEHLTSARVFDVYEGEQIDAGHKSLAIRLTYAADDRTLTDEETAAARESITTKLQEIGGVLRG